MLVFKEIAPLRVHLNSLRSTPKAVGFVPTMGALHEGHLSLIRASKKSNPISVCSIYVNPTQFGNAEDLARYPRTLEADLRLLEKENCDIVFCPSTGEMYSEGEPVTISFPGLDNILEGEFRPGHFSGVAQVVSKLFNLVQPHRAYFGQKDFQQVMVISRMVAALKFPVEVVMHPTVREPDGLAMSSRNQRLSEDERQRASVLYSVLMEARKALLRGESLESIQEEAQRKCTDTGVQLEYLAMADRKDFTLLTKVPDPSVAVLLIAAKVGPVRLIDNLLIQP